MARLVKSGKNAGVIVVSTKRDADLSGDEVIALCKAQVAMKRDEEAAYMALVNDLGSVRAANRALRQS
jgi:hypothetical protein